jgi:hypothetical protein
MAEPQFYMVFDVESVGLHGEGFAVGWVVVDTEGGEVACGAHACDPRGRENASGDDEGRAWVLANVPHSVWGLGGRWDAGTAYQAREAFWEDWQAWKAKGAILAADCPWPVEARFLAACVDDDPEARRWGGPYPFIDVASVRLAAGLDPLGTEERLPSELPIHDPLADARQSARLLIEALKAVRGRTLEGAKA